MSDEIKNAMDLNSAMFIVWTESSSAYEGWHPIVFDSEQAVLDYIQGGGFYGNRFVVTTPARLGILTRENLSKDSSIMGLPKLA